MEITYKPPPLSHLAFSRYFSIHQETRLIYHILERSRTTYTYEPATLQQNAVTFDQDHMNPFHFIFQLAFFSHRK